MTNSYNRDLHTHTIKEYQFESDGAPARNFTYGFIAGVTLGSLVGVILNAKTKESSTINTVKNEPSKVDELKAKANDVKEQVQVKVDELKTKAEEVKEQAQVKVEEVKAKANEVKEDVKDKAEETKAKAKETKGQVKDKANEVKEKATEQKKENKATETNKDTLAAQRRAIKEEVEDESLKEPIAIVDKELKNGNKSKK